MSVFTAVPDAGAPGPQPPGGRVLPTVLTALACAAQAFVLCFTFVMGLGWGGVTYVAALVQAAMALGLIAWLASRKRSIVVLVPVLSAALTAGLAFAGQAHGRATACSDQERAAAEQLAPPPGMTVEYEGYYIEGCLATTRMSLSNQDILEHYQDEFSRHGWRLTPGRQEATVGTAAEKDGLSMVVEIATDDEGGFRTLEAVVGDAASTRPCLFNTVSPSLRRTPTTAVEPGTWAVLVSTEDAPASVVIRDSTSAVVFEQRAQRRPGSPDDMLQAEDMPEGLQTLLLKQGSYQVECRPKDGAVTTVPLRVAWASPTEGEQEKDVVLRVFETPEG